MSLIFAFGSMRALLTLSSLVTLLGCTQQGDAPPSVSNSDSVPFSDTRPAGDSHFSADEQRMIAAARAHLEENSGEPLDARYHVKRTQDGYEVYAQFVLGYENGRPVFYAGGHGTVVLSAEGTVTRYKPGM